LKTLIALALAMTTLAVTASHAAALELHVKRTDNLKKNLAGK